MYILKRFKFLCHLMIKYFLDLQQKYRRFLSVCFIVLYTQCDIYGNSLWMMLFIMAHFLFNKEYI